MEYVHLVEKLAILEEYIAIKFGLDFKEFLRQKRTHGQGGDNFPNSSLICRCGQRLENSPPLDDVNTGEYQHDASIINEEIKIEPVITSDEHEQGFDGVESFPYEDDLQQNDFMSGYSNVDVNAESEDHEEAEVGSDEAVTTTHESKVRKGKSVKRVTIPTKSTPAADSGDRLRHIHHGITYRRSKYGYDKLILNSYQYTIQKTTPLGKKYWLCSGRGIGCKVRIVQDANGTPILNKTEHVHPPPPPLE